MASKSRYVKLAIGPSAPLTRRGSIMGARVVGEYNEDGKRMVLFERAVEIKPKPVAKRKVNAAPKQAPSPATAFPGTGEAHGA